MVTWEFKTVKAMETYPKSGNRLLGFPADEASFGSSEIKQKSRLATATTASTTIHYMHDIVFLLTFKISPLAFGLPLLDIAR